MGVMLDFVMVNGSFVEFSGGECEPYGFSGGYWKWLGLVVLNVSCFGFNGTECLSF